MAKTILYIAVSLDGYIARANGTVDWLNQFLTDDEDYGFQEFQESVGAVVMGSGTYAFVLDYGRWPYGDTPGYVVTSRKHPKIEGAPLYFRYGSLAKIVEEAQTAAAGKHVWLVGGGRLAASFLAEGLLDEISLFVMPLLLGSGIPLFPSIAKEQRVEPVGSRSFKNGVVELHYRILTIS